MLTDHTKSIIAVLRTFMGKPVLVSLHVDRRDWSRCSVGFVDDVSKTHVRLLAVDPAGKLAGYEVRSIAEVFRVDVAGGYERRLEASLRKRGDFSPGSAPRGRGLIESTLRKAKSARAIVTIWGSDPDDSLVGFVEELKQGAVSVQVISSSGRPDGRSWISLNEVISVDADTTAERKLLALHMKNEKKPRSKQLRSSVRVA